ncbi:apolipophorins [Teleopsis dalmanni]|uniref:apolipophorins n=1 Tax=Teleopsis dalmanni TaxID=139649 RepID=UPI0018CCF40F|nr:apolipophorins [Teleopsis dalmanni]
MKFLSHLGYFRLKNSFAKKYSCTLFAVLLVTSSLSLTDAVRQNPLKNPKICGRPQCEHSAPKFSFSDAIYKYDYAIDLRTEFSGTGENSSDLFLLTNLDLFFPKQCEGFLRINDVKLWNKESTDDNKSSSSSEDFDYYGEFNEASAENESGKIGEIHPKSKELAADIKKNILRFAFHDGLISEVCPNENEPAWVLNFKKGILSAFQNTMMRFDVDFNTTETDVSGTCNVQYSLESTDDVFVKIRKVKNIANCRNRYSTHSILQTTPYTFREDKTIWPILSSESYCNMTIDHNLYREISCYERHQLIPFSNSSTGAVTTTSSRLQLKGEESYSSGEFLADYDEIIEVRDTLLFDHTPSVKPTHGEIKAARDLLKEMCAVGFPNIRKEFSKYFTQFLQTAKNLDYKALSQLIARAASICENGKYHVLESLPYIGSTASYQVMRDEIVANAISKSLAHNWMISLSFIQRPDEETLETFYTILEFSRKKIEPEYTLGASAVVHSYCKHNKNCAENTKIKRIIKLFEDEFLSLFNMYKGERRSRDRMKVILKGLGNMGIISDSFAKYLQEIIVEDIAPVGLRIESVFAFRRSNCIKYRTFFFETYANYTINSEVRIFSYLQAMICPDYHSINAIKTILENEQVNQVGSFVWSHLKNLAKSSSPVKIEAQGLLLNDDLSDKFKLDIRKFSRNFEHSLFFDEYNCGTTTDMNVIFGSESYIPRMVTLNFTADLFGQSVNFFELSARAEGFEELAKSAFGPKGPFNRELFRKKLSFLNRWLGTDTSEDDTLENFFNLDNLRLKRGTKSETDKENTTTEDQDYDYSFETNSDYTTDHKSENRFKRAENGYETYKQNLKDDVNNLGYKLKYDYNNPRSEIGIRIFGNDLLYYTSDGLLEVMEKFKEFDPFFQASKILSGKEVTYSKSRVFLDASYSVPLAIGLPLAIHAFGASSVDLRISGNMERTEPLSDYYFDMEGKFKPSVSVDVTTTMQTDMFYDVSGIKVKSNLYTNSEIEAKLKMRGKDMVSFSFSLPQNTNEIFSAQSELLVMIDSTEVPQTGIENRRSNITCTWPVLDDAIGLKMCSYYSVPDLSHNSKTIYPGLLLSGPLNFSLILSKSDPSAKKFAFEYEREQVDNNSNWSLVFHTPGSTLKRLLVANVTNIPDVFNASVTYINGKTTAAAGCSYDGDPNDRKLDFFFDTNGNRSLSVNMNLKREQDRSTVFYRPKMLLAVNGVNITGLVGTVRINEKNGITQNDIDLSFETRKLQALIRGNVIQSEVTTSTNMSINYRFQANKVETISFEGKLMNTGDKSKTEYRTNVKLKTSAYPKLNFASNGTLLSLQGHTEGYITYNNATNIIDPSHTSSMRIVFARSLSDDQNFDGSRTRASFEVKVPKSKVDFRILAKHEERSKNGTEHNVILSLRYAPEKEATGLFSIHLPRRSLFAVDSYMNISIPEFNSCTARIKLTEKTPNDYLIFLNGSWFTGHTISIRGNYKDKSSRIQSLHQLKLLADSPSFEVTSLNLVYRRNQLVIFTDAQAKYGKDSYGLTAQHAGNANNKNWNTELRLKVIDKEYSMNAKLLSEQPKLLELEVHVDKLRDIHVKVGLLSLSKRKEVSLELKWDANRDPTQRLGLLAEYNNNAESKYDGNLMVTYPDRTISCGFESYTGGPKYYGSARVSWSVNEMIMFSYNAGISPTKELNNYIFAEFTTPFTGWKKNKIRAGVYNVGNLFLGNTSLLWADNQNLELSFKSDYLMDNPIVSVDVQFGVSSTVKDIPTLFIKVQHWQDLKKYQSDLDLRYSGSNDTMIIYALKSNWELYQDLKFQNISGTILLISPLEGYQKGGLAAKFSMSDQREIRGAASLNFDIREFTLAMDGYIKKVTDNMLTVNITTPLEKFRFIDGRFGLNEHKRHAVAEVRAPTAALGAEVLCDIRSLLNFDVKLSVATPIDSIRQAAVIAKVKTDTVDLRGIWNNATIGFTGVWRMHNITDFEYSYTVFTPLAGFDEIGFIIKLIKTDYFIDMDIYAKLAHYKAGVKINGHPKSNLLRELGNNKIELELLYDDDFKPILIEEDEDYDMSRMDYNEFFSYFVDFKLDTLIWPTINGVVDIQEVLDIYILVSTIDLPQGRIDLKNRLYFPDYINVLNVLNVKTPFPVANEIKGTVEYRVNLDFTSFYEKVGVIVSNDMNELKEGGFVVNYTKADNTLKPKEHNIYLKLKTPYALLPQIDITGRFEVDDNIYRGNVTSITQETTLSLGASIEAEENFLETSVGILLHTTVVPHYGCRLYFKKDFAVADNTIDLKFEVTDDVTINKLEFSTDWHNSQDILVHVNGRIKTTMLPLKVAETTVFIKKTPNPQLNFNLAFIGKDGYKMSYGAKGSKNRDVFNVEMYTPIKDFKNISMHGTIIKNPTKMDEYNINGHLYRNMATYSLNGVIKMGDNYMTDTRIRLKPKAGGRDGVIELSLSENDDSTKGVKIRFSAIESGRMCQISGGYSYSPAAGLDFSLLVESTEAELSRINLNGKILKSGTGNVVSEISLQTPWKELGLETVKLRSDLDISDTAGHVRGEYAIGSNMGSGNCQWSWILGENVLLLLESYVVRTNNTPRVVHSSIHYQNPDRSFARLSTGGKLSVDSKWIFELNGTANYRSMDDIMAAIVTKLPVPVGDVHHIGARYRGNLLNPKNLQPNLFIEGKYNSEEANRRFLTKVSYRNVTDLQGMGHVEWGVSDDLSIVAGDFQMLRKPDVRREFYAKLITPKYKNENTLFLKGNYDMSHENHQFVCALDCPASRHIGDVNISYSSLTNMYGHVNSITPFLNISNISADFNFTTTSGESYRYIKGTWPTDSAYFQLHSHYNSENNNDHLKGVIELEVPITTHHRADITYGLDKNKNEDKGVLTVVYNDNKLLDGLYKRVAHKEHPIYTEITDITLENEKKPLGIHYVNTKDVSTPYGYSDIKHVEIFELRNTNNFNLTGELHSSSTAKGQEFKIVAIHPNRTVIVTTNYEELGEKTVRQRSKIELSKTAWIGYNVEIGNFSTVGNESQNFLIELFYPKRYLSTEGYYYTTDNTFNSDVAFKWTMNENSSEKKVVRTGLLWKSEPLRRKDRDNQTVVFTVGHPYLEKDVTFKGTFYRGIEELLKTTMVIDYSNDPEHLIELGASINDLRHEMGYTNYSFKLFAFHKASEIEMNLNGTAAAKPSYYKTESYAYYKRDFYPIKHGKFLALLDLNNKIVDYERISPYHAVRLYAKPKLEYPIYSLNATIWDTPQTNNTGYVYIDMKRKVVRMDFNLTEDASQNLQIVGYIPDSRSGYFDIWRNYDEIRIIDVSSYYKMNHSRLITGRFHWRPKMKNELRAKINAVGTSLYNSFSDGIDFWIKSLYSETVEAIGVVWEKTKNYNEHFINDIGELSVLEEDLEDLRAFINQTYSANDFYIRTVVNFSLTILDELAIRDHIESLPKIFTEILQAMGDSGKALRNSIVWLIETVKTAYNNILDVISRFFHGESLQYLSTLLEKGVQKYDKFVKDLHISFIKYVENLWNKFWTMMSNYWRGVLKRLEPHVFKAMSLIEATAWDFSKELFDFIYKRTNELTESPYFNKVSSFTQDVEHLYKDIQSNDAITNFKKYSMIAWNFFKEKYFKLVPFGAELNEVLTEIFDEIKELRNINEVRIVIEKYNEIIAKLEWILNELQFETRLHQLYALVRNKIRNYAMNAIETADMYREAKTKFIFDPEEGIIDLEQKLPMSWHAFNETPKFEEIPEYKLLAKAQNIFSTTNSSLLKYIYNLRSNLDPKTWLPPYYSQALLVDFRHYMTFDKKFVGLSKGQQRSTQCSYLLANDFAQNNFTLLLEPSLNATHTGEEGMKLILVANGEVIQIDLLNDNLIVNDVDKPLLPIKLGEVTIFRDHNILSIYSETEFNLHCNLEFDLCWFELSGWYFGQTAGLLGTMNNEHFDEYLTSKNYIAKSEYEFTSSWSMRTCREENESIQLNTNENINELCNHFFKSGILSACVDTVDATPFFDMCLEMGEKSSSIRPGHPAVKGVCTAALAYIEACTAAKVPMRVPDECVFCQLSNGTYVPEGTFVELTNENVTRSSDIVFVIEAKSCNANLTESKHIMTLVSTLEEQLQANKIVNNRYAVVAFGGRAPFDKPMSISRENRVFTNDFNELESYFNHIQIYQGLNNDVLQAVSVATKLDFRPGVSKTIILMTCGDCAAHHMRFDSTSILQYLMEEGVNLHILADTEFEFEKTRKLRHFFGLDRELVFTKRFPEGDASTRAQLHIPRSDLGICRPLALETNGSVFSANRLKMNVKYLVKRFCTIFAKRVAKSAVPNLNQTCECSGYNTGVSYMACSPTLYPEEQIDDYDSQFSDWDFDDDFYS